jgi:hypothetical protein
MPRMGLEPTIPVLKWAKTVHALNHFNMTQSFNKLSFVQPSLVVYSYTRTSLGPPRHGLLEADDLPKQIELLVILRD